MACWGSPGRQTRQSQHYDLFDHTPARVTCVDLLIGLQSAARDCVVRKVHTWHSSLLLFSEIESLSFFCVLGPGSGVSAFRFEACC